MTTKELGKITFAEFGTVKDYPFLTGLQLCFKIGSGGVGDGRKYTINKRVKDNREIAITKSVEK